MRGVVFLHDAEGEREAPDECVGEEGAEEGEPGLGTLVCGWEGILDGVDVGLFFCF